MLRRCCEPGCSKAQLSGGYGGNGWYHVYIGFMRHACPKHAAKWRAADQAAQAEERAHSEALGRALEWAEALAEQLYPFSDSPPSQSSISWPGKLGQVPGPHGGEDALQPGHDDIPVQSEG